MKFPSNSQGMNQKVVTFDKGIERKQSFYSKGEISDYQLRKEYELIENSNITFEDWKLQKLKSN